MIVGEAILLSSRNLRADTYWIQGLLGKKGDTYMTTVLIADACKPSLVMTSEVFKDKITGTVVDVAPTGKDAMEYLSKNQPDLCVVDFDLPDVDGPALIEAIRKVYNGPILMTAYPDQMVNEAVSNHLFAFNDAREWLAKPINCEALVSKIERYLIQGYRVGRRFKSDLEAQVVAKAAGRGKRAPKVEGKLVNLSLGGACLSLSNSPKIALEKDQELTLSFQMPKSEKASKTTNAETKIKANIAWTSPAGDVGVKFQRLSELQRKELETYFREQPEV